MEQNEKMMLFQQLLAYPQVYFYIFFFSKWVCLLSPVWKHRIFAFICDLWFWTIDFVDYMCKHLHFSEWYLGYPLNQYE